MFKPPNPWVMGIMSLLAELHAVHDVKVCVLITRCYKIDVLLLQLNLKFEVEVLCKHLTLDLNVSHSYDTHNKRTLLTV